MTAAGAQGLAERLQANSVDGSDFAELIEQDYVTQLRLTCFAGRKLCAIRNSFLASTF